MVKEILLTVLVLLGLLSSFLLINEFTHKEIFQVPTGNLVKQSLTNILQQPSTNKLQSLREVKRDQTFTIDIETFRPISYFTVQYPLKVKDIQNNKILLQQEDNNYEVTLNKDTIIYFKNPEGLIIGGITTRLLKVDQTGIATLSINKIDLNTRQKNTTTMQNTTTNTNCGNDYITSKYGFSKCENGNIIVLNKYITLNWKNPIPSNNKHYVLVFRDITPHPKPLTGDPAYVGIRLYSTKEGKSVSTFQRPEWEMPLTPGQTYYKIPESKFKPAKNELEWKSSLCFSSNWLSDDHKYEWWIEERSAPVAIVQNGCYKTDHQLGQGTIFLQREEFTVDLYGHGLYTYFESSCARPDLASKTHFSSQPKYILERNIPFRFQRSDLIYRMNPKYYSGFYTRPSIHTSLRYYDNTQFYPSELIMPTIPMIGAAVPGVATQMLGWDFFSQESTVDYLRAPIALTPKPNVKIENFIDKVCEDQTHTGVKKSSKYSIAQNKVFPYLTFGSAMKTFSFENGNKLFADTIFKGMSAEQVQQSVQVLNSNDYCTFGRREVDLDNPKARKYFLSLITKYYGFSQTFKDQIPAEAKKIIDDSFNYKSPNVPDMDKKYYMGLFFDNINARFYHRIFLKTPTNPTQLFTNVERCKKVRPLAINKLLGEQSPQPNKLLPGEYWMCYLNGSGPDGYVELLHDAKTLLGDRQIIINLQYGDDYPIETNAPILDKYLNYADGLMIETFIGNPSRDFASDNLHEKNKIDILDYTANVKKKKIVVGMQVAQKSGKPDILLTTYSAFLLAANEGSLLQPIPDATESSRRYIYPAWSYIQETATGKPIERYKHNNYGNNCMYATREYEHAFVIVNFGTNTRPRPAIDNDCILEIDNPHISYIDARTGQPTNSKIRLNPTEGTILFKPEVIRPVLETLGPGKNLSTRNYDCTGTIYEEILVPEVPLNARGEIISP